MSELSATSREVIRKGSKSFAAATALFAPQTRRDAEMLYAWCRHCDDVIDGQALGHDMAAPTPEDAQARVAALRAATRAALAGEPGDDSSFRALAEVAARRRIPEAYPLTLIDGFAMDAAGTRYASLETVLEYCWRVAGVVGVMMALVMGVEPDDLATLRRAQDLGLAFQLTNIARDVIEDAANGRVYLPEDWLTEAGVAPDAVGEAPREAIFAVARRLVAAAEPYYAYALAGLSALPFRSAWAIAAARGVYRQIGIEILRRGPRAWDSRASASGPAKAWLAAAAAWTAARSRGAAPPERPPLWTKL